MFTVGVGAMRGYLVTFALLVLTTSSYAAQQDDADVCADRRADPDLVIGACTRVIQSGRWAASESSWAYVNRGSAFYRKRDFNRAVGEFSEAIRLKPNAVEAYYGRNYAFGPLYRDREALSDAHQIVRLRPNDASSYFARAVSYSAVGEGENAISDYSEAIRLRARFAAAFSGRCMQKVGLRRFASAVEDCNEAVAIDRAGYDALAHRGFAHFGLGNKTAALADFNESLRLGENAIALWGRGLLAEAEGSRNQSERDFTAARALFPKVDDFMARYGIRR